MIAALLVTAGVYAGEGTVTRSAELRSHPIEAGRLLATLAAGTVVEIQERRGFWLRVRVSASPAQAAQFAGKRGWIKFARVRSRAPAGSGQKSSGGFFSSLSRGVTGLLGGGRRNTRSSSTITTGIRGLSADELETAAPDMQALQHLDTFQTSAAAAAGFARQGRLQGARIAYLSAEAKPAAGASSDAAAESPQQQPDDFVGADTVKGVLKFLTTPSSSANPNHDAQEESN